MKNILVVAAHPDDEVLGCGGTIARYVKEGHKVSVMILGEGVTSRDEKRQKFKRGKNLSSLEREAKKANSCFGVKDILFCRLPDNRFDTLALLDIVKLIEKQITKIKPEVVFTHAAGDLNIDHCITHRAVITATRPLSRQFVKEIYAFEVPSSTEWAFQQFMPIFRPCMFIDIKDTLKMKIEALMLYKSESGKFPHPRSAEALTALAIYRGSAAGLEAAEAFELIRRII